ncbi:hypothetical protein KY284_034456 [Solanum tuberosum]|nr:hypothetical protein KY284_034456 [Solanum tuberosum]
MAEGTGMKQLDEKLARHDEHLTELLNNPQDVRNTQTRIQGTLELILNHLTVLERAPNKAPVEQQPVGGLLPIPGDYRQNRLQVVPVPPPKWELRYFEGYDPKVWIPKCERYFNLYRTPDNQKVEVVALYLNRIPENWYHSLVLSVGVIGLG